jgi:hypothetical protein
MTTASFPYQLANLLGDGSRVLDGEPIRAIHFNRLHREIVAIQSVLGKDIEGGLSNLKARLALEMNGDGSYQREVLVEDDQSGNSFGARRYLDTQQQDFSPVDDLTYALNVGYTIFDDPPVVFLCAQVDSADAYRVGMARKFLTEVTPEVVRVWFNDYDGGGPSGQPFTETMAWVAFSGALHTFPNDRSWGMPPIRSGS